MNPSLKPMAHRLVALAAACLAALALCPSPLKAVPGHSLEPTAIAIPRPASLVDVPSDFDEPAPVFDASPRLTSFTRMPERMVGAFWPTVAGVAQVVVPRPVFRVTEQQLLAAAPTINPDALHLAMRAMECASKHYGDKDRLVVIDYSLPSTARRLWVFDLRSGKLLWNEYVLHGRGSGAGLYARSFSNQPDSEQSSLGLFELGSPFNSPFGPAMSMIGLEKGINDHAVERGIWLHGTDYVNDERAATGHVSQSEGCAAVQRGVIVPMIDSLKKGAYLFSYYPDKKWQAASGFLNAKLC
ncbi:TPA: murein L,D-transpeptidase catalytic domain family protein [Burkholderia vietnamiensis]|uniref:murein L,D-transpeptidase catalytic domain family protein n=1 Tax=Burkholderia pseudomallei TaxID=28450 RepID=UPI0021F768C0|nr:murein L,D-transpeptidase catalytic domain family protein [Burkholderia pseudomallei]MCW0166352.1 murein L,D-transpeptidase catalytic domain family protein [Burkholderia pseudomallei]HDR9236663.1 murein L,D-transpeptidase catalytic domain family protein [Burkholderia vietnamiensis]